MRLSRNLPSTLAVAGTLALSLSAVLTVPAVPAVPAVGQSASWTPTRPVCLSTNVDPAANTAADSEVAAELWQCVGVSFGYRDLLLATPPSGEGLVSFRRGREDACAGTPERADDAAVVRLRWTGQWTEQFKRDVASSVEAIDAYAKGLKSCGLLVVVAVAPDTLFDRPSTLGALNLVAQRAGALRIELLTSATNDPMMLVSARSALEIMDETDTLELMPSLARQALWSDEQTARWRDFLDQKPAFRAISTE